MGKKFRFLMGVIAGLRVFLLLAFSPRGEIVFEEYGYFRDPEGFATTNLFEFFLSALDPL